MCNFSGWNYKKLLTAFTYFGGVVIYCGQWEWEKVTFNVHLVCFMFYVNFYVAIAF